MQPQREKPKAGEWDALRSVHKLGNQCADPAVAFQDCLDSILETAIALTQADRGNIQLLDVESGALKIAAHSGFEEPFLEFFARVAHDDAASCGTAMALAKRVIVEDVTQSEIFAETPSLDVLLEAGVVVISHTPGISKLAPLSLVFDSAGTRSVRKAQANAVRATACLKEIREREQSTTDISVERGIPRFCSVSEGFCCRLNIGDARAGIFPEAIDEQLDRLNFKKGVYMADTIIVATFDNSNSAYDTASALKKLMDEKAIDFKPKAGVMVKKDEKGNVSLLESKDRPFFGTAVGTAVGALIGLIGGAPGAAVGAALGATTGVGTDVVMAGLDSDFVESVTSDMRPGMTAIIVEADENSTKPVDDAVAQAGGHVRRQAA